MTDPAYGHIGGAVVCDHGPLTLAAARALSLTYSGEAEYWLSMGETAAGRACAARALALRRAADDAALWRRAAGWRDPEAADHALSGVAPIKPPRLRASQN